MDTLRHSRLALTALAVLLGACSLAETVPDARRDAVRLTPDDPAAPRSVRFEVPTALLLDLPGASRVPITLQARIATRELAAQELAAAGYCRDGFTGPERIFFSDDRSRSAFVVRCLG